MINDLMYTGLSEYESRAYIALLGSSPASAYEISKSSGIPTSKVYEVLARLEERGVATQVEVSGKNKYVPQSPEDFLRMRRHLMETTLNGLEVTLDEVTNISEASVIWNISSYDDLLEKSQILIENAKETLLLSLWEQEAEELKPSLLKAKRRGVKIAILHFGAPSLDIGTVYAHPIEHTLLKEKGGRGIVAVSDSVEALVGTVKGQLLAEGALSRNDGFVSMAEDYIKHDIYMMKVVARFDPLLKERFGRGYEKLRDVFSNKEEA